jgi:hypothetical protein
VVVQSEDAGGGLVGTPRVGVDIVRVRTGVLRHFVGVGANCRAPGDLVGPGATTLVATGTFFSGIPTTDGL